MTDVLVLDGVTVDADTGEILSDIPGDRVGWLAAQLSKVKANLKGWEQAEALLKKEAERCLLSAGVKSIGTEYGSLVLMVGRETLDAEAVRLWVAQLCEEDPEAERQMYRKCANGFSTKKAKDWLAPRIGLEETQRVVREGRQYVQLNPPRAEAPQVISR